MLKTLNDLLDVAINDEINAQRFYRILGEKTNNPKLKEFFNSLSNEELGHERILKGVKEMELYDGSLKVNEASLLEIEGAHVIEDDISVEDMTLEKAMEIAMKREDKASKVYRHMAETTNQEEIMKLFTSISADERRHFNNVEQQYKIHTGQMGWEA